jgi:hypothetical protein
MDKSDLEKISFSNCITENRLGRFQFSRSALAKVSDKNLSDLFKNFVIIRVETWQEDTILYTAYSPIFQRMHEGFAIPHYYLVITTDIDASGRMVAFEVTLE